MPQRESLIFDFVSHCETTGRLPDSLGDFAQSQGEDPQALKALFPSLLALEQAVYQFFCAETLRLLEKDPAYADYDLQERLLAFYYTLFELFQANEGYVTLSLKQGLLEWQNLPKLSLFKQAFCSHLRGLFEPALGPVWPGPLRTLHSQATAEAAWLQFLSLLGFWLRDRSPERGRSDMLIEKSVAAALEIWRSLNWQHTPNLLRFWLEELAPKEKKK